VRPHEADQLSCQFADDPGEGRSRASVTSDRGGVPSARGGVTSEVEPTHLGRPTKTLVWAAAIVAIIAAVWAVISISLSSS
jgi:hypothetical protein